MLGTRQAWTIAAAAGPRIERGSRRRRARGRQRHHEAAAAAITCVVADLIVADVVWTFDRRWSGIDSRVVVPPG